MSEEQSSQAADPYAFLPAGPEDLTPALPFPRMSSLPPDLLPRSTDLCPPPEDEDMITKQQAADLIEQFKDYKEITERMCNALLDPGGQLDRMGQSWEQKLALLASSFENQIGKVIDLITKDRLEAGRGSQPHIELELPVSVLIVDDEPMICKVIADVLGAAGITTHTANDADDAMHILQGELPIDLVLCDLRMPKNGKGLAATILKEHPRVSVILMSGNSGNAATAALALGAHGAIGKPFPSNEALILAVKVGAEHRRLRVHGPKSTQ